MKNSTKETFVIKKIEIYIQDIFKLVIWEISISPTKFLDACNNNHNINKMITNTDKKET